MLSIYMYTHEFSTFENGLMFLCVSFFFYCYHVGCVMTLQFRYQRAKLYRQVAMGQSHTMSISQGELS